MARNHPIKLKSPVLRAQYSNATCAKAHMFEFEFATSNLAVYQDTLWTPDILEAKRVSD
ncbi:hypothetical protein AtubIFM61612_004883 [Aspergillus tubingensis]|nr:hypothetical protein AtubIFM61612_004883 [Aspergillus tubingensis]